MTAATVVAGDEAALDAAAAALRDGALVAFPTETVYGLGGDATNPDAVAAIYAAKARPRFNPLICHYPHADAAFADVRANSAAQALAAAFWPGPLTLVLPARAPRRIALLATAGLDRIGVRAPSHALARALLAKAARPVAAPSANRSGAASPTRAAHVAAEFADAPGAHAPDAGAPNSGRLAMILDGGACPVGLESTVIGFDDGDRPVMLRPGGATRAAIEAVVGPLAAPAAAGAITAPGQLRSHYAPTLPVRLNVERPAADEAFLGFGAIDGGDAPVAADLRRNLSARGDLVEAAAGFFAALRALDAAGRAAGARAIAVAPIPNDGLGEAIRDRLARAAAPRDERGAP